MKYKGVLMWLNSHKKHLISNEEYAMAEVIDDAIKIINLVLNIKIQKII